MVDSQSRNYSLLGWKDFSESLFAQTRDVDAVKQYPAYGIAMQAKLADMQRLVDAFRTNAATSGIAVVPGPEVALTADYYGTINPAGQLPLAVNHAITLFGADIVGDPRTLVEYELDGVVGSQTAPGVFLVTGVNKAHAILTLKVTFSGVLQGRWTTHFVVAKGDAPLPPPVNPDDPPPPEPPGPVQTPTQLLPLLSPNSNTSYALVGSALVVGGFTYRLSLSCSLVPGLADEGVYNLEIYAAVQDALGAWVVVGEVVIGEPAYIILPFYSEYVSYEGGTVQGYVVLSRDIVLPAGSYTIGLFAKLLYPLPVNFGDSALLEAI